MWLKNPIDQAVSVATQSTATKLRAVVERIVEAHFLQPKDTVISFPLTPLPSDISYALAAVLKALRLDVGELHEEVIEIVNALSVKSFKTLLDANWRSLFTEALM